jgi:hypothetical protein
LGDDTWYGVVMGQSGITMGMALYDDVDMLDVVVSGRAATPLEMKRMSGLSLVYGEAFEMSPIDVAACERFGWPLATSEAYPHAVWLDPGMVTRAPTSQELELLTAALRAIPDYIDSRQKTPCTVHVPVADGKLELTLSWLSG